MKAVTSHAPIRSAGESTSRAISADTRKIPDPIIEPITNMVELVRPRPLTNSRSLASSGAAIAGLVSRDMEAVGSGQWSVVSKNKLSVVSSQFSVKCFWGCALTGNFPILAILPNERLRQNWQPPTGHCPLLQHFTPECVKILLLIYPAPVSDRISPQRSQRPLR